MSLSINLSVNWLDALILLIFFWLTFVGLTAGLLRSGVTVLAFVVGVFLAGIFYERLAFDLTSILPARTNETIIQGLALVMIFAATSLAGQLIAVSLKQVAAALFLGPLDQIGGLVLGLAEAFILVELILIFFAFVQTHSGIVQSALRNSLLAPFFLNHFPLLLRIMPASFRDAVNQYVQLSS